MPRYDEIKDIDDLTDERLEELNKPFVEPDVVRAVVQNHGPTGTRHGGDRSSGTGLLKLCVDVVQHVVDHYTNSPEIIQLTLITGYWNLRQGI